MASRERKNVRCKCKGELSRKQRAEGLGGDMVGRGEHFRAWVEQMEAENS